MLDVAPVLVLGVDGETVGDQGTLACADIDEPVPVHRDLDAGDRLLPVIEIVDIQPVQAGILHLEERILLHVPASADQKPDKENGKKKSMSHTVLTL